MTNKNLVGAITAGFVVTDVQQLKPKRYATIGENRDQGESDDSDIITANESRSISGSTG
ncbi:MAG: hypothetical protein WBB82_05345 [Limnothrix sp.]